MLNSYPIGCETNRDLSEKLQSPAFAIRRSIAFLIVFVGLLCGLVMAQTFRGAIVGTVKDPNGAVVPGADVTAKEIATGLERKTITDADGNYSIQELPIGLYMITVRSSGFDVGHTTNIQVGVADQRRVDLALDDWAYRFFRCQRHGHSA